MKSAFILGLDYQAENSFSCKHAYVDEFFYGNIFNVTEFTCSFVSIDNQPIPHVLYAFDKEDVTVVFLEHNNTICMGGNMIDYLANPIQCEDNNVRIGMSPKLCYPKQ